MFRDLFHPTRSGTLSEWTGHYLFHGLRRWPGVLASAGPLAIAIVIFCWAGLISVGFAFIYWTVFPSSLQLQTANQPTAWDGFWWCLYYSLEMLTTLGLGDIQPNPNWLRILSASHTLVGFSLVTASITWILLIFPALRRMRTLARKAHTLHSACLGTGVSVASNGMHNILAGLAEEVIRTRVDLIHYPILFYFYSEDSRASIAHAVFCLRQFARYCTEPGRDELVRLAASALNIALDDLSEKLSDRLSLHGRSPDEVFDAFAELHLKPHPSQT